MQVLPAPHPVLEQIYLHLSWAVVVLAFGARGMQRLLQSPWVKALLLRRTRPGRHSSLLQKSARGLWTLPLALAVWTLLPWPYALSAYAALAFQTPSLSLFVWAVFTIARRHPRTPTERLQQKSAQTPTLAAILLVVLGWGLCIDMLNAWPSALDVNLYFWGFDATALIAVLLVCAGLALFARPSGQWTLACLLVLSLSLLRLPNGNLWDALLDPFVFVAMHWQLWRHWKQAARQAPR